MNWGVGPTLQVINKTTTLQNPMTIGSMYLNWWTRRCENMSTSFEKLHHVAPTQITDRTYSTATLVPATALRSTADRFKGNLPPPIYELFLLLKTLKKWQTSPWKRFRYFSAFWNLFYVFSVNLADCSKPRSFLKYLEQDGKKVKLERRSAFVFGVQTGFTVASVALFSQSQLIFVWGAVSSTCATKQTNIFFCARQRHCYAVIDQ